ncbi:enoyl-CoA hydratase/isomerase family protein [Desulfosporosinus fructosivorans]
MSGGEFALACDIRIAAENAVFGFPEVNFGVYPGWGGTQRLPRVVWMSKAKEITFTGDKYGAEECLSIGLIDKVGQGRGVDG